MFDTLLMITLFLIASLLVCLLTLRSSINIKHLCLFFYSLPVLMDFLKFRPPPHLPRPPLVYGEGTNLMQAFMAPKYW